MASQSLVDVFKVARDFAFHFVESGPRGEECDVKRRAGLHHGSSQYAETSHMAYGQFLCYENDRGEG